MVGCRVLVAGVLVFAVLTGRMRMIDQSLMSMTMLETRQMVQAVPEQSDRPIGGEQQTGGQFVPETVHDGDWRRLGRFGLLVPGEPQSRLAAFKRAWPEKSR